MDYAQALHVVGRAMRADIPCSVARTERAGSNYAVGLVLEGETCVSDDFAESLVELDLAELAR